LAFAVAQLSILVASMAQVIYHPLSSAAASVS
jgi:hypothetical protein